jgi:hypothetical protein
MATGRPGKKSKALGIAGGVAALGIIAAGMRMGGTPEAPVAPTNPETPPVSDTDPDIEAQRGEAARRVGEQMEDPIGDLQERDERFQRGLQRQRESSRRSAAIDKVMEGFRNDNQENASNQDEFQNLTDELPGMLTDLGLPVDNSERGKQFSSFGQIAIEYEEGSLFVSPRMLDHEEDGTPIYRAQISFGAGGKRLNVEGDDPQALSENVKAAIDAFFAEPNEE